MFEVVKQKSDVRVILLLIATKLSMDFILSVDCNWSKLRLVTVYHEFYLKLFIEDWSIRLINAQKELIDDLLSRNLPRLVDPLNIVLQSHLRIELLELLDLVLQHH